MQLGVAILWHFHQPVYRDPLEGGFLLPWVRLHAVKDYWGMGRLIEEAGVPVNVNWVPCLLQQIECYLEGERDKHFELAAKPADELSENEQAMVLDAFFSCNPSTMVYPFPRYRQLHQMRRAERLSAAEAAKEFSPRDLRDLQVWANLVWTHPAARERAEPLKTLFEKGSDFTEDDKHALLDFHIDTMAQVIPLYRRLWESGAIEITTSPYYHPILPLLCDMESAKEAIPKVGLPSNWRRVPEDAEAQLAQARLYAGERFGREPSGLWPSEGSVSGDVLDLAARAGFAYAATDEGILAATLRKPVRDAAGNVVPEILYRPYSFNRGKGEMTVFFRDRELSDLLGFRYQHMDESTGAEDFLGRLQQAAKTSPPGSIASIILDGENPWEHYPQQGAEFLARLYRGIEQDDKIDAVTFSGYLTGEPPAERLRRIFAGSWVDRSFAIWISAPEDRTAWEEVFKARLAVSSSGNPEAMRSVYAAEGSDWFWWFGPDHMSFDDAVFDMLFRKHVEAAYRACGLEPPASLLEPIAKTAPPEDYPPRGLVQAVIDGEVTDYFEWLGAGRVSPASGAVLALSGAAGVRAMYYGYDRSALYFRLDFEEGASPGRVEVEVSLPEERKHPVRIEGRVPSRQDETQTAAHFPLLDDKGKQAGAGCYRRILELGLPFGPLGVKHGAEASLAMWIETTARERLRLPPQGFLRIHVPEPSRWLEDWSV